jgi:exonuclease SbcC
MIPLKLQIKNFLSYGSTPQTIDFNGHQLICLSGKNGHGKSALLDALTWALWGQARKVGSSARADEGLVRIGQGSMMVCLDFICNGTTYRVRREYASSSSKAYAVLDFGSIDTESGAIRSLTDKTIRATQEKIEATVGLDFDTFINSAFLRQGQSNEFSKKTAKERKEILAHLLGLDTYEKLRKKANERITLLKGSKDLHEKLAERLIKELEQKSNLEEELAEKKLLAETKKKGINEKQEEEKALFVTYQKTTAAKHLLEKKLEEIGQLERTQHTLVQSIQKSYKNWQELFSLVKKRLAPEIYAQAIKELSCQDELLTKKLVEKMALNEQLLQLENEKQQLLQKKIAAIRKKQEENLTVLHGHELTLQKYTLEKITLEKVITSIEEEIREKETQKNRLSQLHNSYAQLKKELCRLEEHFERRKSFYHNWMARGTLVESELKNLASQQQLLQNTSSSDCPLCEQTLTSSLKNRLDQTLTLNQKKLLLQKNSLARACKKLKLVLIEQHETYKKLKAELALQEEKEKEIPLLIKKREELEKSLLQNRSTLWQQESLILAIQTQKETAQKTYLILSTEATELGTNDPEIRSLQKIIEEKNNTRSAIDYNESDHALIKEKKRLVEADTAHRGEQEKQSLILMEHKNALQEACKKAKEIKKELNKKDLLLRDLTLLSADEIQLQKRLALLGTESELLNLEHTQLLQQLGSLQEKQNALLRAEAELATTQAFLHKQEEELSNYQAVATALGKDGIQALLIEDAIPEIEDEANSLLSRLTDNQAQLSIESLRDLKSGGTKETLEIKISDGIGIRPYEMFSGGEAFRIDFALRIALSKLLARRAGTALQTLIIDEGFGSQDEEGLSAIIEALHSIREDFEKIIIVSHVPGMKDQFPVQFIVQKGANGSFIKVFEQG